MPTSRIENEDRYDTEMTKSQVLKALNRKDEATVAQKKALDLAQPAAAASVRSAVAGGEAQ